MATSVDPLSLPALAEGYYAKKQLACKDRLIAWSHKRRFETALRLAEKIGGERILDYGCGDGTLLGLLEASNLSFKEALGAELTEQMATACRQRLETARVTFCPISELNKESFQERYDTVFCLEVLEHVVELEQVLSTLYTVLAPGATLVVSVPVETGLSLVAKQTVRKLAGWRGIGDYRFNSRYSLRELCKSVFAFSKRQHIKRPVYTSGTLQFHDHKGFNWRALRSALRKRFDLKQTIVSPISWLPPSLSSQTWFVLRKKSY